jgi:hypothetical protein
MSLGLRHFGGISFKAKPSNLIDAGGTIGTKDEAEKLRDPIVEPTAFARILMFRAVSASGVSIIPAAGANLAPRRLMILSTTRTFPA